jgi:hypothetical protein
MSALGLCRVKTKYDLNRNDGGEQKKARILLRPDGAILHQLQHTSGSRVVLDQFANN